MTNRLISLRRDSSASDPSLGKASLYSENGVLKFWPYGGVSKPILLEGDTTGAGNPLFLEDGPKNAVAATATIGLSAEDGVVITAPFGLAWNNFGVEVSQSIETDFDTVAEIGAASVNIYLGTDSSGDPDTAKHTPEIVAAAIELLDGWTATHAGTTAIAAESVTLAGAVVGTPGLLCQEATDGVSLWKCLMHNPTYENQSWVRIPVSQDISHIVAVTQDAYDAIDPKEENTLYHILEEES